VTTREHYCNELICVHTYIEVKVNGTLLLNTSHISLSIFCEIQRDSEWWKQATVMIWKEGRLDLKLKEWGVMLCPSSSRTSYCISTLTPVMCKSKVPMQIQMLIIVL
jgi:hypothetical protein